MLSLSHEVQAVMDITYQAEHDLMVSMCQKLLTIFYFNITIYR